MGRSTHIHTSHKRPLHLHLVHTKCERSLQKVHVHVFTHFKYQRKCSCTRLPHSQPPSPRVLIFNYVSDLAKPITSNNLPGFTHYLENKLTGVYLESHVQNITNNENQIVPHVTKIAGQFVTRNNREIYNINARPRLRHNQTQTEHSC